MSDNIAEQRHKELSTLQTFAFLLKLVEALIDIQDQEERTLFKQVDHTSPGIVAGTSFANFSSQILGYRYVGVFALDPPEDRLRLLGVSGLSPEHEQRFRAATDQTPLTVYLDTTAIHQLHANQVVTLDLKQLSTVSSDAPFGARYLLIAPLVLHEQLIGLFVIAKTDVGYPDIQSAYTLEERELAREIAEMTTRVIERVRLLESWVKAHANELAMQETNRRYDAFLTIASHELRTPLTIIKGNVQLALRRLAALKQQDKQPSLSIDSLSELQSFLDHALRSSDRLKRMIRMLLDVSRIQAGQLLLTMQPCNLVEIVRQAVENARQKAVDRTFRLSLPEEKIILVMADADRIGQVMKNYLSNALKYSPAFHPIEVILTVEASLARVSVRDRGLGLSLEEQALIWERFYRVPGIQAQYNSGTDLGLGLYLCRAIIERHQGHIGVSSAPGEGSTFWFTLPLAKPSRF